MSWFRSAKLPSLPTMGPANPLTVQLLFIHKRNNDGWLCDHVVCCSKSLAGFDNQTLISAVLQRMITLLSAMPAKQKTTGFPTRAAGSLSAFFLNFLNDEASSESRGFFGMCPTRGG